MFYRDLTLQIFGAASAEATVGKRLWTTELILSSAGRLADWTQESCEIRRMSLDCSRSNSTELELELLHADDDLDEGHQRLLPPDPADEDLDTTISRISFDSREGDSSSPPNDTKRTLTYLNGLTLVVSLQIGSGIFSAPSEVSKHVSSPLAGVSVWFLSGLLVWTGAASFIELGRAIPRNGGIQEYLQVCYGDFCGFMFSWIWITIAKPCAMAIIATIFAEHLNHVLFPDSWVTEWLNKLVAIIGLAFITGMNCIGTHTGANLATGFLVMKLIGLFSIVVIGFIVAATGKSVNSNRTTQLSTVGESNLSDATITMPGSEGGISIWTSVGEYVTAVFGALFCYGGWDTVGFVAGEMRNPFRDLPRVINSAMAIVMCGFVLMNVALYMVVPMDMLRERKTVAVTFGIQVFGILGGLGYSLIVAMSCMGALNSNVFATGRLCVAASKRNYLPRIFGDPICTTKEEEPVHYAKVLQGYPTALVSVLLRIRTLTEDMRWDKKVPVYAMVMTLLMASFYITIGSFGFLLTFIGISEYVFFFLAVLGVFILRRQGNPSDSGFRTWTANPIIFCILSAFLVVRGIITDPIQGLVLIVLTIIGIFVGKFSRIGQGSGAETIGN